MKVKELPEDTNLAKVLVELPDDMLKQYKDYAGGEKRMYIVGQLMGDFFMSPTKPHPKKSRKMFPMPLGIEPSNILEWEVVDDQD